MVNHLKMPKYGLQQDEGTLVRWAVAEGDAFSKGDVLCELETDKARFDFEAPQDGHLRKILCQDGGTVPVLSTIALFTDAPDEPFEAELEALSETSATDQAPSPAAAPQASAPVTVEAAGQRRRISPAARKRAEELGVDLSTIAGTGPNGRITRRDVENTAESSPEQVSTDQEGRREPLTRIRRAIGAAMVAAKQSIPHFYLEVDLDLTKTEAWWKEQLTSRPNLTLTDAVIHATAHALADYPALNASIDGNDIIYHDAVHIGLAVGTDDGLLVPVIDQADSRSLTEITGQRSRLVEEARQGRLSGEAQATFTISNLGMFGVKSFSAIINPPESGALAVGTIRDEVRPNGDGYATRRIMTTTLSADHRAVDGLICARYLQTLKEALEDPSKFDA